MNGNQIVYGAARIDRLERKDFHDILNRLYECGVREADTAPSYGDSEKIIKEIIKDFPALRVNSKVGLDPSGNFSPSSIKESIYQSLHNLGLSSINVLFIHSVPYKYVSQNVIEALQDLKREGICDSLGYSGDGHDLKESISRNAQDFDAFMFTYNFLDQSNLPISKEVHAQKTIYIKRVLANGVWRKKSPRERVKELAKISIGHDEYRKRMKVLFPHGLINGHSTSLDFVSSDFPSAKYLVGLSSIEQCKQLTSYLSENLDPDAGHLIGLKNNYKNSLASSGWLPVT